MPWRGPEYEGEFPTLGHQIIELGEAFCCIPDGDRRGEPMLLTDEQARFILWFYRIHPKTGRFYFSRGGQLVRPQKWGKDPFAAWLICLECHPGAPVQADGFDADGEPVGRPWATPWVQISAVSEDQTDNTWLALQPMIELGPLADIWPDTGRTRINLHAGGLIEPVTSSAPSRFGQRTTFVVQGETHLWNKHNGMRRVADTQRRNTAGIGGRFMEITNAWDPTEESVAQTTNTENGVFVDDVDPGAGSVKNKRDRQRMMRVVYGDSWRRLKPEMAREINGWVDLERIDDEAVALLGHDAAQAERYFLNRKRPGEGAAFDIAKWAEAAKPDLVVPDKSLIVVGVDGARYHDALAIVATDVGQAHQWTVGIWERPADAGTAYEHNRYEIDGAMVDLFERFAVWRVYIDPQWIDHLVDAWLGRWGKDRIIPWVTNRPRPIAWAVRNYVTAVATLELSHDDDPQMNAHIGNARRQLVRVFDDKRRQMFTLSKETPDSPLKIDGAMAGTLSWEARGDAIAAGATAEPEYGAATAPPAAETSRSIYDRSPLRI